MRVIKRKPLLDFAARHPDAREPLDDWYRIAKRATWRDIGDVRRIYPSADGNVPVDSERNVTVFNIGGNKFRLVVRIHYNTQMLYVLRVLTHAEYDKEMWKRKL
jgi:mRNA interferase HigB